MYMVERSAALATGHADMPYLALIMGAALLVMIALVVARRLWFIEILATGTFFTLLGCSPAMSGVWHRLGG